jgi:hypothetical protein
MEFKVVALGVCVLFLFGIGRVPALTFNRSISPQIAMKAYHFERILSPSDTNFDVIMSNIEDCEISYFFTSDPTFLYTADLVFYEPVTNGVDFSWIGTTTQIRFVNDAFVRVKSIEIILSTSCIFSIAMQGRNMSTAILYGAGVSLGNGIFTHHDIGEGGVRGDVYLLMSSDMNVADSDFRVSISGAETLFVDVSNPPTLGGSVSVLQSPETGILNVQLLGWNQTGYPGNWHFNRPADEQLSMTLGAEIIYLNLLTHTPSTITTPTTNTTPTTTGTNIHNGPLGIGLIAIGGAALGIGIVAILYVMKRKSSKSTTEF